LSTAVRERSKTGGLKMLDNFLSSDPGDFLG